jgi:hypothetical protein
LPKRLSVFALESMIDLQQDDDVHPASPRARQALAELA